MAEDPARIVSPSLRDDDPAVRALESPARRPDLFPSPRRFGHSESTKCVHCSPPASPRLRDSQTRKLRARAFTANDITTSHYTAYNFVPKNLWQQFQRVANVYFLLIGMLQLDVFFPGLSPTHWSTTIAPLAFVLSINAAKEAYDDYFRHRSDAAVNATPCVRILRPKNPPRGDAETSASRLETDLAAAAARCEELAAELEASREREASAEAARHQRDQNKTAGVIALAVKVSRFERTRSRRKLAEDGLRLGTVSVQRSGTVLQEVWEDGGAFRDLNSRAAAVQTAKDAADDERKRVKGRLPLPGAAIDESEERALRAEFVLSEEAHKVRVAALKREEDLIGREREALEREKSAHIRELKRARDEDSSRFNQHPLLGDRYVLMNMLGRGGFSEVYKAYDVLEMREVACKLHQLNPQWSEQRKVTYVKHAARECEIHKQLRHPSVVQLIDVFEVDQNCFCTVLELCTGDDLDARLKAQGAVSEREARAILAQVFAGLAYMNSGSSTVIHYDLKPGNILFDAAGRVKITDFGLSKKRDMNGVQTLSADTGMELTSQGAGTYWYLPPECFETGPTPPKISSKVDTWSCGVILYQMLFNRRPFGHDQSQEQILHAGTIRHAKEVEFPQTPKVSAECKEFIKRCLAYRKEDRPDVPTAARDPYMTYAKPGSE